MHALLNEKQVEKWLNKINENQGHFWSWIQFLHKENEAQTSFDNEVSANITDIQSKLSGVLELAKAVKELKQQVAALQLHSHKHVQKEETT